MPQPLTEFFKEKTAQSAAAGTVDWQARKVEWLAAVAALYRDIETYLREPIEQGVARVARRPKVISESHLGTYDAEELVLFVADEEVVFSPRGRNVVGAAGRVDVRGDSGEAMLIVQPGPRWGLVRAKVPQLSVTPFDEAAFGETLKAVMRQ